MNVEKLTVEFRALAQPGTAMVMNRVDQTFHQVRVPCFDPILDLDSQQDRLNEAVEILSLLMTTAEMIKSGMATDQAIAGVACMLRRSINLISAEIRPVDQQPETLPALCTTET